MALVLWSSARAAFAGAALSGLEVEQVREAEHALAIHIDGLVARVETRQVVVNQGDRDSEVIYSFDLPADAAVLGAEVRLPDGRRSRSAAVDERSAFRFVPDEPGLVGAPDLGLLRLLAVDHDSGLARYELRVYPVAAGRSATAIVRWAVPVQYHDGRLGLRLPDRGGAANLVREEVELVWRAPAGARGLRDVRAGSRRLAAGAPQRFSAPAGADLVLEATPVFAAGQGLVAELAAVPIDRSRGAIALSLLSPDRAPAAAPRFERVLVVVDRSRSLGASGLAAARALADAMLSAANPGAAADVVLFDREARAVRGGLSTDLAGLRTAVGRSFAEPSRGGSDLGAALALVGGLLRRQGPAADSPVSEIPRGLVSPTLVVIVTDGMLPLALDGERARSQIGTLALAEARVTSIVLVPDDGAVPDVDHGPLAELARSTGGRVLAVRHREASARAARMWSEVTQPAPYEGIEVDWPGAVVTGDAPARLESGQGALVIAWYHGPRPAAAVSVRAELRGRPVAVRTRAAGAALARAALPLALVQRPAVELLAPAALDRADAEQRARIEQVAAAHRAGVATGSTALVLLDPNDGFARDRLALASKWGTGQFRRFPPPAERRLGELQSPAPGARATRPGATPAARRTGELDRALVERLMKQHVVPRARACYQQALRRQPGLAGTAVIELEMARGEVQHAEARSSAASPLLSACLVDAAYDTPVPKVALGESSETIVVARYPLRFQTRDRRIDVSPAPDRGAKPIDPDDPLGGL